jgi:hypothetical protein
LEDVFLRFLALTSVTAEKDVLSAEYKNGREIGIVKLGDTCLFFRRKLKVYYIPYTEIHRCFRRVVAVKATLCCGKGNFEIENLVIHNNEKEVAQIQLPGTKAARILMDELKVRVPGGSFTAPKKSAESAEEEK